MTVSLLLLVLALTATVIVVVVRRRVQRRRIAFARVLNAADALESRLRAARTAFGATPASEGDPVRVALQEMLRQRLWLQEHGASANLEALDAMCTSIRDAHARLDTQLDRVTEAREAVAP